jgi:hypothetical protein
VLSDEWFDAGASNAFSPLGFCYKESRKQLCPVEAVYRDAVSPRVLSSTTADIRSCDLSSHYNIRASTLLGQEYKASVERGEPERRLGSEIRR